MRLTKIQLAAAAIGLSLASQAHAQMGGGMAPTSSAPRADATVPYKNGVTALQAGEVRALTAAPDLSAPPLSDPEPAASEPARDASVYRVGNLDLGVTALAIAGAIAPNQFPTRLIHTSCAAPGSCAPGSVNGFDRFAVDLHSKPAGLLSDATVALSVAVPAIADGFRLGLGPALREDLTILTETIAVNAALVTGVKYLVQRPLPVTYARRDGLPEQAQGYRSFYSGHTSTAVAALTASAWTLHFRDGPQAWPWIVTGVVGASVAAERVLAGRHFPSDVLVGAAAGFAVGTAIPWLHARRPWGKRGVTDVGVVPAGRGLALALRW
jgi:membrane-associated phospholipid phosphatase